MTPNITDLLDILHEDRVILVRRKDFEEKPIRKFISKTLLAQGFQIKLSEMTDVPPQYLRTGNVMDIEAMVRKQGKHIQWERGLIRATGGNFPGKVVVRSTDQLAIYTDGSLWVELPGNNGDHEYVGDIV